MLGYIFRSVPEFRGKRRLARMAFGKNISEDRNIQVRGKWSCQYLLPNLKENVAFSIYINGVYEEDTIRFLIAHIPPNGTLLDLGANIGAISVPLCKKRNDIKVYGVEASPWVYEYLTQNIRNNRLDDRIIVVNNALFDEDKKILPFVSPKDKFGHGSLALHNNKSETIDVESIKVDTLLSNLKIPKVDFIKIDIEGYEYFAFKGAHNLLSGTEAPDILFEFSDWNEQNAGLKKGSAQEILIERGYKLFLLKGKKLIALDKPLDSGFCLIYATKKSNER